MQPYKPAVDEYLLVECSLLRVGVGPADYLLEEGDAFYFGSDAIHRFESPSPLPRGYIAVRDYVSLG